MKLLDLFPTADALFTATHGLHIGSETECYARVRQIQRENAKVLTAFDRCYAECGPPDVRDFQKAMFCIAQNLKREKGV